MERFLTAFLWRDDVEPNVHVRLQCEQVGHPDSHGSLMMIVKGAQGKIVKRKLPYVIKKERADFSSARQSLRLPGRGS